MSERLINQIDEYWTGRAKGYSKVNQEELETQQKEKWLGFIQNKIQSQFPTKQPGKIQILDIGTGPGFFAIILAKAGYQVTAVDYTEAMLEEAKLNAGKWAEKIQFLQMDGQNLDFSEESFDVVLSRNLTWVLENPDKAYESWRNVLKIGGLLLNFDANWYSYLYSDEKKMQFEADRQQVEAAGVEDYNVGENFDVMEDIARKVPLSAIKRPEWDVNVLKKIQMDKVKAELDAWQHVWSASEKINFASTPMFMVSACKA